MWIIELTGTSERVYINNHGGGYCNAQCCPYTTDKQNHAKKFLHQWEAKEWACRYLTGYKWLIIPEKEQKC